MKKPLTGLATGLFVFGLVGIINAEPFFLGLGHLRGHVSTSASEILVMAL